MIMPMMFIPSQFTLMPSTGVSKTKCSERSVLTRVASILRWSTGSSMILALGVLSSPAIAQSRLVFENPAETLAIAPQLLTQQVIDGLPPPPPIPDLQVPEEERLPQGSGPDAAEVSGELFMVYVNGDSPLLLEQVRQVDPTATLQVHEGQQVILAGLFDRSGTAIDRIEQLGQRGIEANMASVSSVVLAPDASRENSEVLAQAGLNDLPPADPLNTLNQVNSRSRPSVSVAPPSTTTVTRPPANVTNAPRQDNAYYVVIPGEEDELGEMWEQVVLLGAVSNAVEQRDRPLGPHLLVGPFVDQDAATRWNRYFQDFGMDARVYYKR